MSLFEKIFRPKDAKKSKEALKNAREFFHTLSGYRPVFTSWGGEIYESELVRAAIDAKARHVSKLKFETQGTANPSLQSKLEQGPNQFQTWSQFFYRLSTILDVNNTAFIAPVFDERMIITGMFPVLPQRCELIEYDGEIWVRYRFSHGQVGAVEFNKCGIMTKHQYKSDFFGEKNTPLDETMKLIHIENEGIENSIRNAFDFKFQATLNNFANDEDLANERNRFVETNIQGEDNSFLILFPNVFKDVKQIDVKAFEIDPEQQKLIEKNVFDYFGVNEKILQNSANAEDRESFFDGAIEPFSIQFSEVASRMLFSERERALGAKAMANANRLQYMSTSQKVQMAKELGDRGALMIDEIRELFNYEPLPNGAGKVAPIRGEYKPTESLGGSENADE